MPTSEEYMARQKKAEQEEGNCFLKTAKQAAKPFATILAICMTLILVGLGMLVLGLLLTAAIFGTNVYVGVSSGSAFVKGSEGQYRIGDVSLQWVVGRFVLFTYFFYPLVAQIISLMVAFFCPPKLKNAPTMEQILEKEHREYLVKIERERTKAAIRNEAKMRKQAMISEIAIEEIRIRHKKLASQQEKERQLAEMREQLKKKYEIETKAALQEKYAKMKKIEEEKSKLIRAGTLTPQKQKELEKEQANIEKVVPLIALMTEPTGIFTEETKRESKVESKKELKSTAKPGKTDNKVTPVRRNSIDTKATAKTAATKKTIPKKEEPKAPNESVKEKSKVKLEVSKEPATIASPVLKPPVPSKKPATTKHTFGELSKKAGQTPARKYVPGVRNKMKVPTFNNTAGKGPLRIPDNYKFANERLANL